MENECKVTNPYGTKGSEEHQKKVAEVAEEVTGRGLSAVFEYFIELFGKSKKSRFSDVAGVNPENEDLVELHHISFILLFYLYWQ